MLRCYSILTHAHMITKLNYSGLTAVSGSRVVRIHSEFIVLTFSHLLIPMFALDILYKVELA